MDQKHLNSLLLCSCDLPASFPNVCWKIERDTKKEFQIFNMLAGIFMRCLNVMNRIVSIIPQKLTPCSQILRKNMACLQVSDPLPSPALSGTQFFKAHIHDAAAFGDDTARWIAALERHQSVRPQLFYLGRCCFWRRVRKRTWYRADQLDVGLRKNPHRGWAVFIYTSKVVEIAKACLKEHNRRQMTFRTGSKTISSDDVFSVRLPKCRPRIVTPNSGSRSNTMSVKPLNGLLEKITRFFTTVNRPVKNLTHHKIHTLFAMWTFKLKLKRIFGIREICHE